MIGLLDTMMPFLQLFLYAGQSSYLPKTNKYFSSGSSSTLTPKIPTIMWFVSGCSINLTLVWFINFKAERSAFMFTSYLIMINVFNVCQLAKFASVFIQSVFHNRAIHDAIQVFLNLETFFEGTLRHKISYGKFRRQILLKILLIFIVYIQTVIYLALRFIQRGFIEPLTAIIKLSQFRSILILIHIIFFVDLLRFHLVQLNEVIQRDANENEPIQNSIVIVYRKCTKEILMGNKYRNYKHAHYHLWNATQHLNYYFGWCLILVFLQAFIDCVYISYWLYTAINIKFDLIRTFRKFLAILLNKLFISVTVLVR